MKKIAAAAVAAICVLCTNLALADDTYVENNTGKDQSVIFKDDPLAAGGFGPHDTQIRVLPSPKRVLLLRPRTQFVTEMLKSVEAL